MTPIQQVPSVADLIDSGERSAVHLEMRDAYGVSYEAADFERWRTTGELDLDPDSGFWAPWVDLVRRAVARGVIVRRARIVSEPVSDYIRYEHACTQVNLGAGEDVRWLPRRQASGIALPGNDFWLVDGHLLRWNHFSGAGESLGGEMCTDPGVVELCAKAFEAVWRRATPHHEYEIR